MRQACHCVARERGVGGDHRIEVVARQRVGESVDLGVIEIGCDLERHRHPATVFDRQLFASLCQALEHALQVVAALQLAQILGVGRRDVDGDIAGMRIDPLQAKPIVVQCPLDRGVGILADVQAQHPAVVRARDVGQEGVDALVVEAQPVDQRTPLGQAEHPGPGVAGLGTRSDGAHLDETESHRLQGRQVGAVLVQAGGQADPIGEPQAHHLDRIADRRTGDQSHRTAGRRAVDLAHRQFVGALGIDREQQRSRKGIQVHGNQPGMSVGEASEGGSASQRPWRRYSSGR